MRRRRRTIAKRPADLSKAAPVEPAVTHTLLHRPAVRGKLIAADMVVAALVVENE
jgi:hypothetical protein